MEIRFATALDGAQMDDIYAYYVDQTVITFALSSKNVQPFSEKTACYGKEFPYLVCVAGDEITGYAYASAWRYKQAYRWDVELSVYVKKGFEKNGIGKQLYEKLLKLLTLQGYKTAYAGITLPNEGSMKLHEKFGFTTIGVFKNTGYKQNQWLDVIWLEKQLNPFEADPKEPKTIEELLEENKNPLL